METSGVSWNPGDFISLAPRIVSQMASPPGQSLRLLETIQTHRLGLCLCFLSKAINRAVAGSFTSLLCAWGRQLLSGRMTQCRTSGFLRSPYLAFLPHLSSGTSNLQLPPCANASCALGLEIFFLKEKE